MKHWKTIELGTEPSLGALFATFRAKGCSPGYSRLARALTERGIRIAVPGTTVRLARLSLADLGLQTVDGELPYTAVIAAAQERGYELCTPEVGPQLRLQYRDQPDNEFLTVLMEPLAVTDDIRCRHGVEREGPYVFSIDHHVFPKEMRLENRPYEHWELAADTYDADALVDDGMTFIAVIPDGATTESEKSS